jgi:hypothetical protein
MGELITTMLGRCGCGRADDVADVPRGGGPLVDRISFYTPYAFDLSSRGDDRSDEGQ